MKISQISPYRNFNFGNSETTPKNDAGKNNKTTTRPKSKLARKVLVPMSILIALGGYTNGAVKISHKPQAYKSELTEIIEDASVNEYERVACERKQKAREKVAYTSQDWCYTYYTIKEDGDSKTIEDFESLFDLEPGTLVKTNKDTIEARAKAQGIKTEDNEEYYRKCKIKEGDFFEVPNQFTVSLPFIPNDKPDLDGYYPKIVYLDDDEADNLTNSNEGPDTNLNLTNADEP